MQQSANADASVHHYSHKAKNVCLIHKTIPDYLISAAIMHESGKSKSFPFSVFLPDTNESLWGQTKLIIFPTKAASQWIGKPWVSPNG
uniref:Uncharacterized protein n=1 Tax=Romanomermis culicivorax TaxID=13658 RepID=A0A915J3V0_ROMCU